MEGLTSGRFWEIRIEKKVLKSMSKMVPGGKGSGNVFSFGKPSAMSRVLSDEGLAVELETVGKGVFFKRQSWFVMFQGADVDLQGFDSLRLSWYWSVGYGSGGQWTEKH